MPLGLYTFKNVNADFSQQLNNFINQYPFAQQQNVYQHIQNNLSTLQAQIQQQNFQLSSYLRNLLTANGNYMWGGDPIGIYNGNEVPNGNVQAMQANDHVENNNRVLPNDERHDKSHVIVLLSQDEIRKWKSEKISGPPRLPCGTPKSFVFSRNFNWCITRFYVNFNKAAVFFFLQSNNLLIALRSFVFVFTVSQG